MIQNKTRIDCKDFDFVFRVAAFTDCNAVKRYFGEFSRAKKTTDKEILDYC